jgi:beta-phosphoglucomutase-like phosphatase (HAD superfamily)
VKDRGLKTALVTSSIEENTRAVLRNVSDHEAPDRDLAALFDAMVFGNEIEHLKPSPDIYIEALRRIDTPATHALALEDSSFGVLAAKKAGLRVIAVPGPHTDGQDFVMADEVATSLTDVLERGLIV